MSSQTKAIVAIVIASLFWSTAGIVAKVLLKIFDPFTLAFLRSLVGSICILPFLYKEKHISIKNIVRDIVPAGLLTTTNIALFYFGMRETTVNASAVMYAATPLIVTIIATLTIHEEIGTKKLSGIITGFLGVLSILLIPALGRGEIVFGTFRGNALLLIGVVCWASYSVISRHLTTVKRYSPTLVTAVSIFSSVPIFFLFSLFTPGANYQAAFSQSQTLLLILYLGFFVTVVPYGLHVWAIKHSSATTASLTNYLQPVFAFYFAWIFLGETLTPSFLFGSLLVLLGVFLATGTRLIQELKKIFPRLR